MSFSSNLRAICAKLTHFYGIDFSVDPMAFVIDESLLKRFKGSLDSTKSQVLVAQQDDGEQALDLALYFPTKVKSQLDADDPLLRLSLNNLDSLWQLIEELSHFLLLASRSAKDLSTTALELEWQGEIDKVLIAAQLLAEQTGKSQALDIASLLHYHCRLTSAEPVYDKAQYFAQKFWYHHQDALDNQQNPAANGKLAVRLRTLYPLNWQEKLRAIA